MATKENVINNLEVKSYGYNEVKHLIGTITSIEKEAPSKYKKGDVYSSYQGVKKRPIVIIKVVNNIAFGIPMTTQKDEFYLHEHKSRFFKGGYFTNQIVSTSLDYVNENFLGVLDDNKNINIAIKKLKQLFSEL